MLMIFCSLDNPEFNNYINGIYLLEPEINETTFDQYPPSFLDLLSEIHRDNRLCVNI